jgi:anaerobic magnesium-protoporphyrin IX monomethyl ester cyclase
LLRRHGILSLVTWVTDFEEVSDRDFTRSLRQLLWYDPDQIMSLYVTPHRWTGYYRIASERRVIQLDRSKWDYKHQVLESPNMPPWRIFLWVKFIEIVLQLRPKALWRSFLQPDRAARHGMSWFTRIGRRVVVHECWNFFFRDRRTSGGPTLKEFWGVPQDPQEVPRRVSRQHEKLPATSQQTITITAADPPSL